MQNKKSLGKFIAYIMSSLLFAFYVFMLIRSVTPQVSEDYRMRYLEEGYFWDKQN